jgi:hypothetical protein
MYGVHPGKLEGAERSPLAEVSRMHILSFEASTDLLGRLAFRAPGGRPFRWEAIMQFDVNPEEADLLRILLEKDLGETRVEVHHSKNMDYKSHLQAREKMLLALAARLKASA